MAKFLTPLKVEDITDSIWRLVDVLAYQSDILGMVIFVPEGFAPESFYTDLASVPRVPLVYDVWGSRCHHEAVIHDYLYRIDSKPVVSRDVANNVFLEAMGARGKPWYIKYPMWWGVCLGGHTAYHKKKVEDKL